MAANSFLDANFTEVVKAAIAAARLETLQAGVPIFYSDIEQNIEIMEQPDGRKFDSRTGQNSRLEPLPLLTIFAGPNGSGKSSIIPLAEFEGKQNLLEADAVAQRPNG